MGRLYLPEYFERKIEQSMVVEKMSGIKNFICNKLKPKFIDCHQQINSIDCGLYCAYNTRLLLHAILISKFSEYNITTLLDDLLVNPSIINPKSITSSVIILKEIAGLRKKCADAIVNISLKIDPNNLRVRYQSPLIDEYHLIFPFVDHMGEPYEKFSKEINNLKINEIERRKKNIQKCFCTLVRGCLVNFISIDEIGNQELTYKNCLNCANKLGTICIEKLAILISNNDESHEYSTQYCENCMSSYGRELQKQNKSDLRFINQNNIFKDVDSKYQIDIFGWKAKIFDQKSKNVSWLCEIPGCGIRANGIENISCTKCVIVRFFCDKHKNHINHSFEVSLLDQDIEYDKSFDEDKRELNLSYFDKVLNQGDAILENETEEIDIQLDDPFSSVVEVTADDFMSESFQWQLLKSYGQIIKIHLNGRDELFLRDNYGAHNPAMPPRFFSFSPFPFNENHFYPLYAWILLGIVIYANIPYLACCVLVDQDANEINLKNKYRYILARVMLTMCDKPIRGYIVYDTDSNNPDLAFQFLRGIIF
jgi:hypothetical protein